MSHANTTSHDYSVPATMTLPEIANAAFEIRDFHRLSQLAHPLRHIDYRLPEAFHEIVRKAHPQMTMRGMRAALITESEAVAEIHALLEPYRTTP
jgi:hypothetical protein